MNHLYYGDNLTIMQRMRKHAVDLIYLDPPFNSKQNYNLIYRNLTGKPVPNQADAFCDTWDMDPEKEELARKLPVLMREHGIRDHYVEFWRLWINALRHTQPHLLAYLIYMVQRLLHMKSILRPTGSIYLHCDPTASHYIKVMMDGIFGDRNFRNEIVWKRTFAHGSAARWGDTHDTLLFYTMSDLYTWNRVEQALDTSYIDAKYRFHDARGQYRLVALTRPGVTKGASGQPWRGYDPTVAGRHWAVPQRAIEALRSEGVTIPADLHEQLELLYEHGFIRFPQKATGPGVPEFKNYLPSGQPIQDIIADIPPINSQPKDGFGYPARKPEELLKRIIAASTNKGDLVFDPFCGCGTTIYAAEELGRNWIGCDIAILAIKLIREHLTSDLYRLVEGVNFKVGGIPISVEQAEELWKRDPSQFEHWIVERVGGFPTKKTGAKGIDGRMYFETPAGLKSMVLSVKGGKLRPTDVRDLRGVMTDEPDCELAGFLSIQEPSKAMREAASLAMQYEYNGVQYDRMQFLTVADILEGKREFHTPTKVAARPSTAQASLPLAGEHDDVNA